MRRVLSRLHCRIKSVVFSASNYALRVRAQAELLSVCSTHENARQRPRPAAANEGIPGAGAPGTKARTRRSREQARIKGGVSHPAANLKGNSRITPCVIPVPRCGVAGERRMCLSPDLPRSGPPPFQPPPFQPPPFPFGNLPVSFPLHPRFLFKKMHFFSKRVLNSDKLELF